MQPPRERLGARGAPNLLAALLTAAGAAPPPALPVAASKITAFEVALVSTTPASGAELLVTPPNDTPIDQMAAFSVSVPRGQSGLYVWNTAVQAERPLGFVIVPIATTTFRQVPLVDPWPLSRETTAGSVFGSPRAHN